MPRWMRWLTGRRSKNPKEKELQEVRRRTDQIVKEQEAKKEQAEAERRAAEAKRRANDPVRGASPNEPKRGLS
jgi:hypothetical protein